MWPFKRRRVVSPFRPVIDAMAEKDPDLYREVAPMPVLAGARRWHEKYPEDFADLPPLPHCRIGKITLK